MTDSSGQACLIIHPVSYQFVASVARYIHRQLNKHFGSAVELRVSADINAAGCDSGIKFIIGDPFGVFARPPNCKFVFLNFSLLYAGEGTCSRLGRQWVTRKHGEFSKKIHLYDYVLDYHPQQISRLKQEFAIAVDHFPIGLFPNACARAAEPEYDVCMVGARTPRRAVIERRLTRAGLRLSPMRDVTLEDVAARSKIVLNVHAFRSPNVEIPRVVSALMSGAVLVSETLPDIATSPYPISLIGKRSEDLCVIASYRDLDRAIQETRVSPQRIQRGQDAAAWVKDHYLPSCDAYWRELIGSLRTALRA
jgi:hypothetical protein